MLSAEVTKAIVPAAGLGMRLRPLTCKTPKEMFPVKNMPAIEWVVKEILGAGIEEIGVIISRRKRLIREYFEDCTDYRVSWIYQQSPRGLGDAILTARDFIGGSTFLMALPDDLFSGNASVYLLKHFQGSPLVALWKAAERERGDYGDVEIERVSEGLFQIHRFALGTTDQSNIKVAGRYVITPEVYDLEARRKRNLELREGMLFNMTMEAFGTKYYGILLPGSEFARTDIGREWRDDFK
ncbi:MAG: sugar phosphate nucleotidyltransferase [Thermodesulfobacteriota bacterium]|nr:sugar phosphate nucleotidyltransferase [Thermodesulfobacteriota bacterium]